MAPASNITTEGPTLVKAADATTGLTPLHEAQKVVLDATTVLGIEKISLLDALGRVLGEDIVAERDNPPWDNSAMESFFSSLKTERTARKVYRTRDEARADVFDYIERFYNPRRRHSKLGYLSPMAFEAEARQT